MPKAADLRHEHRSAHSSHQSLNGRHLTPYGTYLEALDAICDNLIQQLKGAKAVPRIKKTTRSILTVTPELKDLQMRRRRAERTYSRIHNLTAKDTVS